MTASFEASLMKLSLLTEAVAEAVGRLHPTEL
jgi:hypothetical protein